MKSVILFNSKTKKTEIVKFSGYHEDVFELIGKKVNELQDIVVQNPDTKEIFHILFDKKQETNNGGGVLFGNVKINGNVVISLLDNNNDFLNVTETHLNTFKPIFSYS